jgi:TetR/AcrR family transcriptional regulator
MTTSPPDSAARDAILAAAEELFARQGFKATTIKQLAGAAGVNSALLYYYFTDKENLYHEVLNRLISGFAAAGIRRLEQPVRPDEALRQFVVGQVEFMLGHPRVARLVVREMVDHEAAHAEQAIATLAAGLFERLRDLIALGQSQGIFRSDVDPRFAAVSTVSQVAYVFVARPAIGILLGHGPSGPPDDVLRAYARQTAELVLASLLSPTAPPATQPQRRPFVGREMTS